jgi:hypothetical protein
MMDAPVGEPGWLVDDDVGVNSGKDAFDVAFAQRLVQRNLDCARVAVLLRARPGYAPRRWRERTWWRMLVLPDGARRRRYGDWIP